ncbi:hypothetical protein OYC64_013655 [Pagothenia borchgrevinki]|uniref:Uncharacterized protein n=1 Tax=Pagothenia borchgrevinki TaxID=8213 RepID=A0ABD2FV00_PAGBO
MIRGRSRSTVACRVNPARGDSSHFADFPSGPQTSLRIKVSPSENKINLFNSQSRAFILKFQRVFKSRTPNENISKMSDPPFSIWSLNASQKRYSSSARL